MLDVDGTLSDETLQFYFSEGLTHNIRAEAAAKKSVVLQLAPTTQYTIYELMRDAQDAAANQKPIAKTNLSQHNAIPPQNAGIRRNASMRFRGKGGGAWSQAARRPMGGKGKGKGKGARFAWVKGGAGKGGGKGGKGGGKGGKGANLADIVCYKCGNKGHYASNCPSEGGIHAMTANEYEHDVRYDYWDWEPEYDMYAMHEDYYDEWGANEPYYGYDDDTAEQEPLNEQPDPNLNNPDQTGTPQVRFGLD
jgi:hypothetical protein